MISAMLVPVVAIGSVFTFLIVAVICDMFVKMHRTSRNTNLKIKMVEAGMAAAEIETVLHAGEGKKSKKPPKHGMPKHSMKADNFC